MNFGISLLMKLATNPKKTVIDAVMKPTISVFEVGRIISSLLIILLIKEHWFIRLLILIGANIVFNKLKVEIENIAGQEIYSDKHTQLGFSD